MRAVLAASPYRDGPRERVAAVTPWPVCISLHPIPLMRNLSILNTIALSVHTSGNVG